MKKRRISQLGAIVAWGLALALGAWPARAETFGQEVLPNSDLETDADQDGWPDGWPALKSGGAWVEESGNHFIRLTSTSPGTTTMLYREIPVPEGAGAFELAWKQRVTGLTVGKEKWFDARILMEFKNSENLKVPPTPSAPFTRKDTDGWVDKRTTFLVPEGARILKFMPCLFQVNAGTFDLDDIHLRTLDPGPVRAAAEAAAAERARQTAEKAEARRLKAAQILEAEGTLIPNGGFELDGKTAELPKGWGPLKGGGSWEREDSSRFLRLAAKEPGKMVMVYRTYDIPHGVQALELGWKQRVTGLKRGTNPWFDARIILEFKDEFGKKIKKQPAAPYTQKDTDGWVEKSKGFLVPEGALTLVLMPCLFQTKAGTFDLDDLALKPTDPEPLLAAAHQREREIQARYVPPEEPNQARWPKELKVVGNRLHDPDGKEVWLQGVNAGGLETLPQDDQPVKSLVVAIEDWKANCVRVPMKEEFWYGQSPYQQDGGAAYRAKFDQMVTLAANRGAYIVIDLHRYRAPQQKHADFWKDCAARYKDHPAVLFDLFNEPHGISWDIWKKGGLVGNQDKKDESAFLTEEEKKANQGFESIGMQGLVDAVRSTGARNIVIAGGLFWCNDLSGITKGYALEDRGGNGIMYSWHTYNWHTGWEAKMLETAAQHPIFLGEVGADSKKMDFIPAENQEDPYTWVPDMLGFIQKHKLNWTGWCFHPRATPVMISDWSYTPTPYWGSFAKQALAGQAFELKKVR